MKLKMERTRATCPYCGLEQYVPVKSTYSWEATHCDEEMGGCSSLFVYKTEIEIKVFVRKVEGEQLNYDTNKATEEEIQQKYEEDLAEARRLGNENP